LFRFIIYGLAFFFIYRLVVRTMQYLRRDSGSEASKMPQSPLQNPPQEAQPPRDIRDAQYRDLPDDSQKPS
jgi:hypothetical protein